MRYCPIEHPIECESKDEISNSCHLGVIGVILIPGKRNNAVLNVERVAADDILLTVMLNGDINRARMTVSSTKAIR